MTLNARIFVGIISLALVILIVELVRRRKLREEFSWLWILAGFITLVVGEWYGLQLFLTRLSGAVSSTSIMFFLCIIFLMAVNIHMATKISLLITQVKNLTQELSILQNEVKSQGAAPSQGSP
ncbi:MAG: DUF2304 domain-containing protein [Candidatus Hydrogenedentota bacterium]|nr:MAG: DUF2304 domain-containing protein [Candidatus Hydrogenedentota bacterium]